MRQNFVFLAITSVGLVLATPALAEREVWSDLEIIFPPNGGVKQEMLIKNKTDMHTTKIVPRSVKEAGDFTEPRSGYD